MPRTWPTSPPPVGRLKRAGADIVLHTAGPSDVLAFFLAMHGQDWKPAAVLGCGDGYALRETGAALGPLFDGTLVVAAPFYPPDAAAVADAYQRRYGMAPRGPQSLAAYVGAKLVFDTLNTVRGDPAKLLDALRATISPKAGWRMAGAWLSTMTARTRAASFRSNNGAARPWCPPFKEEKEGYFL